MYTENIAWWGWLRKNLNGYITQSRTLHVGQDIGKPCIYTVCPSSHPIDYNRTWRIFSQGLSNIWLIWWSCEYFENCRNMSGIFFFLIFFLRVFRYASWMIVHWQKWWRSFSRTTKNGASIWAGKVACGEYFSCGK